MLESVFNAWEQANAKYEELCSELESTWDKIHELTPYASKYEGELDNALAKVGRLQLLRTEALKAKTDLEALFDNLRENPTFTAVEI